MQQAPKSPALPLPSWPCSDHSVAQLKVTDSPPRFSSRSQRSAPPTHVVWESRSLIGCDSAALLLAAVFRSSSLIGYSAAASSRSPPALRGRARLLAGKGGACLRGVASHWSSLDTLDHRVGGTRRVPNLAHKMAAEVRSAVKGVGRDDRTSDARKHVTLGPTLSFERRRRVAFWDL